MQSLRFCQNIQAMASTVKIEQHLQDMSLLGVQVRFEMGVKKEHLRFQSVL